MKRLLMILVAVSLAGVPVLLAQQTTDLDALFARAQRQETIAADLAGAISSYSELIEAAGPTNALTPRAMLRLAECHRKLGHAEAAGIYAAIVRDYPNSGEAYDTAVARLAAMEAAGSGAVPQATTFEIPTGGWGTDNWEISPDGRSVAWVKRGGTREAPDSDVMIRDLGTGSDRVLMEHIRGTDARLAFSPSGSHLAAFAGLGLPNETRHPYRQLVISRVEPAGSPVIRLDAAAAWEDALPVWSPSGRQVAFLGPSPDGELSDVRVLDIETAESRSLGVAVFGRPDFQWFPGQDRLAFRAATEPGVAGDIHLVWPATLAHEVVETPDDVSGQMRITGATSDGRLVLQRMDASTPNRPGRPSSVTVGLFNPSSRSFTVTCEGAPLLERRDAEDGSRDQCLEIIKDGRTQLYWNATTKRLMMKDLADGTERPLTVGAAEEHFGMLSPDERVQAFISNRDGEWSLYAAALDLAPVAQPVHLGNLDFLPDRIFPRWTNRGLVLGVYGGTANIFRVDMNPVTGQATGPVVRLTQDHAWNAVPTVSPDGEHIGYWVTQGQSAIAVMNADGSNERLVTPRQFGYARYLTWLSDDSILFTSTMPGDLEPKRLAASASTGTVTPVGVPLFENPAWENPASNWDLLKPTGEIVHVWAEDKDGPFELRARSISMGAERTIAAIPVDGCPFDNYVVSPDGKTLGYQLGPCNDAARTRSIGIVDVESGGVDTLIASAVRTDIAGLSSDGRFMAYVVTDDLGQYRPRIMDLETRDHWPLMPEAQQPTLWIPLIKWAPDNTFLVFMQGRTGREWRHWTDVSYATIAGGGQ